MPIIDWSREYSRATESTTTVLTDSLDVINLYEVGSYYLGYDHLSYTITTLDDDGILR